jgi:hypothetical protein
MRLTPDGTAEKIQQTELEKPVDLRAKKITARRGQILLLHSRITTLYEQEAHGKRGHRKKTAIYCIFARKRTRKAKKKSAEHKGGDLNPLRGCRITVRKSRRAKLYFQQKDRSETESIEIETGTPWKWVHRKLRLELRTKGGELRITRQDGRGFAKEEAFGTTEDPPDKKRAGHSDPNSDGDRHRAQKEQRPGRKRRRGRKRNRQRTASQKKTQHGKEEKQRTNGRRAEKRRTSPRSGKTKSKKDQVVRETEGKSGMEKTEEQTKKSPEERKEKGNARSGREQKRGQILG